MPHSLRCRRSLVGPDHITSVALEIFFGSIVSTPQAMALFIDVKTHIY